MNALAFCLSPRYRRLIRARAARAKLNLLRAARHRSVLSGIIWKKYLEAGDYAEARLLAFLIAHYHL